MVKKLIKASHLKRYVQEMVHGAKAAPAIERITANAELPLEPQPTINYILGSPIDNQYQSKRQKKRLLRAATVRAWVNTIHVPDSSGVIQPLTALYHFPLLTHLGSLLRTTMHSYLLCVLTIVMCTEYWLTLAVRPTCYNYPPSGK